MNKRQSTFKKVFTVFSFLLITVSYNNCGRSGAGPSPISQASTSAALNGDIIPIPNTKTSSVIRASRVLDNLVSCLGTVKPSTASKQEWARNRGTISEEGLANTLTQPMLKSIVSISAQVCNDLLQKEIAADPSERRIFPEVDLNSGGFSSSQVSVVSRRLARSCWGRNPTDEEINTIVTDLSSAFESTEDNRTATRNKAIYLCTSMASSFSTYEM